MSKYLFYIACFSLLLWSCSRDKGTTVLPQPKLRNEILAAPMTNIFASATSYTGDLTVYNYDGIISRIKRINIQVSDFRRWFVDGQVRYTYFETDPTFRIEKLGYFPSWWVILDSNLNELKRVNLLPFNGRTASSPYAVDGHDGIMISDNHYIVMAYILKTVNNIPSALSPAAGRQVIAPVIQEVNNGKVIWEWNGTNYPELYTSSVESNDFSDTNSTAFKDYAHLNSMTLDPNDGNIVCSFRNLNQVLKINRGTGDIIWRLGGKNSDFPLTADQVFLRQHDVTFADNGKTLLMFDNGEITQRPYSRVVEFKLDEASKTVAGFKAMTLPADMFGAYMGSVQKLDHSYFICTGSTPKMAEIDFNTGETLFKMDLPSNSYRAYKY